MSAPESSRAGNRLAHEQSPYLRQHAQNPVDWYPWGEEAFARARGEQRPIFLSIGYSTCHWCHVMAHESFEDSRIAETLNRDFVPIKVDREERPDIDRIYMTYVQAATGYGGWPMTVWLTPDLKPFYGGTYFPPDDRWGRPGLVTVLAALTQSWKSEREKLLAEGERVAEALRDYVRRDHSNAERAVNSGAANPVAGPDSAIRESVPDRAALADAFDQCFQQLQVSFDSVLGGFGGAPKFPRAAVFNFLFRVAASQGPKSPAGAAAVQMAELTLRQMASGGIHDHVGGGFHRYSVDEEWFVPHFEKMLYDQAQLAMNYLEARQATGDERYAWVARDIYDYVLRDLAHPAGGFCSAEDADSLVPTENRFENQEPEGDGRHAEGAFYVWSKTEIERLLGEDAKLFCAHFGVQAAGNVPEARDPQGEFRGQNILRQLQPLAVTARQFGLDPEAANNRLAACLVQLRARRARRPRPHRDDKILTAWNGLMISALAKGHQVLEGDDGKGGSPSRSSGPACPAPRHGSEQAVAPCLAAAIRAAEFLRRELYDQATGALYRSYRDRRSDIPGFAEDYAFLVQGLLDLYEASFQIRWLQWAEALQAKMDELFWDDTGGGYFNSRADDPAIIARLKEDYDGAEPAASSVAVSNLLRLEAMLGEKGPGSQELGYRERALRTIAAMREQWERAPQALPQMLGALELVLRPPRVVVLAGSLTAGDFRALTAVLHEQLRPRRALLAADGAEGQRWLGARQPYLAEMKPQGNRATAYVCADFACQRPVTEPAELRRSLE